MQFQDLPFPKVVWAFNIGVSDRFEEIEPVKVGKTDRFDEIEPMPDEEPIFQTSSADFIVNIEDGMKAILPLGMLILGIAALGFLNGLDYLL